MKTFQAKLRELTGNEGRNLGAEASKQNILLNAPYSTKQFFIFFEAPMSAVINILQLYPSSCLFAKKIL